MLISSFLGTSYKIRNESRQGLTSLKVFPITELNNFGVDEYFVTESVLYLACLNFRSLF